MSLREDATRSKGRPNASPIDATFSKCSNAFEREGSDGRNAATSTASGTTRIFSRRTPLRANTSAPHAVGTHTSRIAFARSTCAGSSLSVSNIVRPTTYAWSFGAYPRGGHGDV